MLISLLSLSWEVSRLLCNVLTLLAGHIFKEPEHVQTDWIQAVREKEESGVTQGF